MELRPEFQVQMVIKALTDVIAPAVDPANKLAIEQVQLSIGMLSLLARRLPRQFRYDRHDLAQFVALAQKLRHLASDLPEAAPALVDLAPTLAASADVLERARAEPAELEAAGLALRAKVGAVISLSATTRDEAQLKHVNAAVMAHAREMLLRERAWLSPQGWEPGLPDVETLIGAAPAATLHA
jgi:hypothetical protein